MNKNLLVILGFFLALIVVGMFWTGKPKKEQLVLTPSPISESAPVNVTPAEDSVREITVSGNEYSFIPSSIDLVKGEKVRIIFTNVGNVPHNLVIDELKVSSKTISRGKSDTLEITAGESGTFSFYCSVGNHRDLGMEGEVKVE